MTSNNTPNTTAYLFVYGTLRRASKHPLAQEVAREARYLDRACVQGQLFLLDGYPGLIPSTDPRELVYGDLYRLPAGSQLLQRLDAYEECSTEDPQPHEFLRRQARITTNEGQSVKAWLYLYNRSTAGRIRIASGDFFRATQSRGELRKES